METMTRITETQYVLWQLALFIVGMGAPLLALLMIDLLNRRVAVGPQHFGSSPPTNRPNHPQEFVSDPPSSTNPSFPLADNPTDLVSRFDNLLNRLASDKAIIQADVVREVSQLVEQQILGVTLPRTPENYPLYGRAAMVLTLALYLEIDDAARAEAMKTIEKMVEFGRDAQTDGSSGPNQSLLYLLIAELRDANLKARDLLLKEMARFIVPRQIEAEECDMVSDGILETLVDLFPLFTTRSKAWLIEDTDKRRAKKHILQRLLSLEQYQNEATSYCSLRNELDSIPKDEGNVANRVNIAANRLCGVRDSLAIALRSLSAPSMPSAKDMEDWHRNPPLILDSVFLAGANLEGVQLQGSSLDKAHLEGSFLQNAQLRETKLVGASLQAALLLSANLSGADLWHCCFVDANLLNAKLTEADLNHADLSNADLRGAQLQGAVLYDANLSGTSLYRAMVQREENEAYCRTDFTGANWPHADFRQHEGLFRSNNGLDSPLVAYDDDLREWLAQNFPL